MRPTPKSNFELNKMRAAGRLAAEVLDHVTPHVQPGTSTLKLNDICHDFIKRHGAISATVGYKGYPAATCISVNDVVCHGIPNADEILKDGDILNIDVTVILDGYHGDTSRMYYAGTPSDDARQLVETTYHATMAGIAAATSGAYLEDIAAAIENIVTPHKYGIVKEYCGHGLGKHFHEEPQVAHYTGSGLPNPRLKKGLTFTVEPMVNIGTWRTELQRDNWTVRTADRTLSAQFEHTIAVTEGAPEILTLSPSGYTYPPYR